MRRSAGLGPALLPGSKPLVANRKYKLAGPASQDIDEIWDFTYSKSFSVEVADHVLQRIYESFDLLGENPLAGHIREDLTDEDLRFWSVFSYLVVYRPGADPIEVLAILHSARDVAALLSDENSRLTQSDSGPQN